MKSTVQKTASLAVLTSTLLGATSGFAAIVYDNSSSDRDLNRSYFPANNVQFGDEIFVGSSERTITDFRFETFLSGSSGNETGVLILNLNDGPTLGDGRKAPGTEIYRSDSFNLGTGRQTVIASGLSVDLPANVNNFTWSVVLNGIDNAEQAGLLLYNPPTVGSSFSDFWQKNGDTWSTLILDGGATPVNFAARVTAVPEPSTWTFGAIGLAVAGYLSYRRRKA